MGEGGVFGIGLGRRKGDETEERYRVEEEKRGNKRGRNTEERREEEMAAAGLMEEGYKGKIGRAHV